jgi:hypothetical protein
VSRDHRARNLVVNQHFGSHSGADDRTG